MKHRKGVKVKRNRKRIGERLIGMLLILTISMGLFGCRTVGDGPRENPEAPGESGQMEGASGTDSQTPSGDPDVSPAQSGAGEETTDNWVPEEALFREEDPTEYQVISVEDYLAKTTSGLLAQFVGTLSGYEFVYGTDGRLMIALPDSWFEICNGPYAEANPHNGREDKLLQNEETGLWEVWTDDDYHVDILNQFILADAFERYGTFSSKCVMDGWVNYDVWDMGGGHREAGAYALSRAGYLPVFSGSAEFGNAYSWCSESYIENETLGMAAAGMPNAAVDMADVFTGMTSDCAPALWAKLLVAMYSMAYFENDIPTLIREAQGAVLPEGSWQSRVVDMVFDAKEKYPDNWRDAAYELEKNCIMLHYKLDNPQIEPNINNAFVLMALLYGDGDYYETCRIASLAGYDADCTAAEALGIVGILQGMEDLPPEVNEKIWQDGQGVVVNQCNPYISSAYYMYCAGLPERIPMTDIVDLYRRNFEHILLENGGRMEDGNYYIPRETLRRMETVFVEDFEDGLGVWNVTGEAESGDSAFTGKRSAEVKYGEEQNNGISTLLTGLKPGARYRVTAYVNSSPRTFACLYAKEPGAEDGAFAVAGGYNYAYVKRDFVFRATAETMELGFVVPAGNSLSKSARIDDITVTHVLEREPLGDAAVIVSVPENGIYKGKIEIEIHGRAEKELYLKLVYANPAYSVLKAEMTVNGEEYAVIPFGGMGNAVGAENADASAIPGNSVYIPMILSEDVNTVTLDVGPGKLYLFSAEIVSVTDRW